MIIADITKTRLFSVLPSEIKCELSTIERTFMKNATVGWFCICIMDKFPWED